MNLNFIKDFASSFELSSEIDPSVERMLAINLSRRLGVAEPQRSTPTHRHLLMLVAALTQRLEELEDD